MESLLTQSKLFITGTDTGVGKSIITALLANLFIEKGEKVSISKPLQTGTPKDTEYLASLTEKKVPIFNTYDFKLPAAPSVAANDESKTINPERIIEDIRKLEKEYDVVLVEGVGGIAVPIITQSSILNPQSSILNPQSYLVADLIKDLNYPTVVVCRPSLGTINHSILTLEYAKQKGLNVLGFIISGFNERSNDKAELTAPKEIEKMTAYKCLAKIPQLREEEIAVRYKQYAV